MRAVCEEYGDDFFDGDSGGSPESVDANCSGAPGGVGDNADGGEEGGIDHRGPAPSTAVASAYGQKLSIAAIHHGPDEALDIRGAPTAPDPLGIRQRRASFNESQAWTGHPPDLERVAERVRAATSGLTAEERSLICVLVEVASLGVVRAGMTTRSGSGVP